MVACERRRPAATSAAEMGRGPPPTPRRQPPPLYQPAGPQGCVYVGDRAISPSLHDAQAGGSSASSPLVVPSASVAHHGRFRSGGELWRASGRTRAECCFRRRAGRLTAGRRGPPGSSFVVLSGRRGHRLALALLRRPVRPIRLRDADPDRRRDETSRSRAATRSSTVATRSPSPRSAGPTSPFSWHATSSAGKL